MSAKDRVETFLREIQGLLLAQLAQINHEEDEFVKSVLDFNKMAGNMMDEASDKPGAPELAASLVNQAMSAEEAAKATSLYDAVTMAVMMIGEGALAPSTFCRNGTKWADELGQGCAAPTVSTDKLPSLSACVNDLNWKVPTHLPGIAERFGSTGAFRSAMLVGQEKLGAHFTHTRVHVGLMYLSKGTKYPAHAHEAGEWYLPLSGGSSTIWRRGNDQAVHANSKHPGGFVVHGPGVLNSFETTTEDLLCLYYWHGKLDGTYAFAEESA